MWSVQKFIKGILTSVKGIRGWLLVFKKENRLGVVVHAFILITGEAEARECL